jgi:hypothetical protein
MLAHERDGTPLSALEMKERDNASDKECERRATDPAATGVVRGTYLRRTFPAENLRKVAARRARPRSARKPTSGLTAGEFYGMLSIQRSTTVGSQAAPRRGEQT